MRLTTRSLVGITTAAAITLTAAVGGVAAASHRADDKARTTSSVQTSDDRGGLTARDLRNEPGDDRRPNGSPTIASTTSVTGATRMSSDDPAGHDAGDDKGGVRAAGTSDDPAGHDAGDDKGGVRAAGTSDDPAGHDAADDHGRRHGRHGSNG